MGVKGLEFESALHQQLELVGLLRGELVQDVDRAGLDANIQPEKIFFGSSPDLSSTTSRKAAVSGASSGGRVRQ